MNWELTAGCKVNLYLDITGIRPDGYHELESLFVPMPVPCDTLCIREGGKGLALTCSVPELVAESNIICRAYSTFAAATGYAPDLEVLLEKRIPMGAGLGGGSSDGAVFLAWLNHRAGEPLNSSALHGLALPLGADVPFFLENRPAWVTGIGEKLEPAEVDFGDLTVVVVCPDVHVNTAWAYRRWDEMYRNGHVSPRKLLTGEGVPIKKFSFANLDLLWNSFEDVVFQEYPALPSLRERIFSAGAEACVMSGSGSSFVCFFDSLTRASGCVDALRADGISCHGTRSGKVVI